MPGELWGLLLLGCLKPPLGFLLQSLGLGQCHGVPGCPARCCPGPCGSPSTWCYHGWPGEDEEKVCFLEPLEKMV